PARPLRAGRAAGDAGGPADGSRLNRIEPRFTALRHFAPDGTDQAGHAGHRVQGSVIRRHVVRPNEHSADGRLHEVAGRADVA
ncbi:hypothetical protein AB0C32_33385, partial [Streptosporangium sp. NPDC048865]